MQLSICITGNNDFNARWPFLSKELLESIRSRIVDKQRRDVNRVLLAQTRQIYLKHLIALFSNGINRLQFLSSFTKIGSQLDDIKTGIKIEIGSKE